MSERLTLRYSRPALRRDYWRAAAGILMCVFIALLLPLGGFVFWLIAGTVVLFVVFGALTALKHASVVEIDDQGIARHVPGPLSGLLTRRIEFGSLDRFVVRYFGRRRDRRKGIVELWMRSGGARLTIDYTLEDFDEVVRRVRAAARARNLALDPTTTANLASLGFG